MILPFSTQLNGKPTYFLERIWEGLMRNVFDTDNEYQAFLRLHRKQFGKYWDWFPESHKRLENPKIHTIREDAKDRWQVGTMIDFFINCRQPTMFRFAPRIPVVSIQEIEIIYYTDRETLIKDLPPKKAVVVGNSRLNQIEIEQLAQNDGFDTIEDFFAYFNDDFKGKIIHWTNLKY
tara:strand:+ start:133 stop:663 length:531 start_codon:yes stop_codon:yes gene_type:complete